MKILSEYHGSKDYPNRKARVLYSSGSGTYYVNLYRRCARPLKKANFAYSQHTLMKSIHCDGHSLRYAEDCAENYVMGWGMFDENFYPLKDERHDPHVQ
tara:strand:+ start:870 stop:1166 length:297 start_codon:yes stop_codon:yes gene_type:complete